MANLYISIFINLYSFCTSEKGICKERVLSTSARCCSDYYMDLKSGSCLPCIGSFGNNCSSLCPDGYFGHGCRDKCECNETAICDPSYGCIINNNGGTTKNITIAIVVPISLLVLCGMVSYVIYKKYKRIRMASFRVCCPCTEKTGCIMCGHECVICGQIDVKNDYEAYRK